MPLLIVKIASASKEVLEAGDAFESSRETKNIVTVILSDRKVIYCRIKYLFVLYWPN